LYFGYNTFIGSNLVTELKNNVDAQSSVDVEYIVIAHAGAS